MLFPEILATATFSLVGLILVFVAGYHSRALAPAIVSYAVHYLASLSVYSYFGLLAPDAEYYDAAAQSFALGSTDVSVTAGKEGWIDILSAIYEHIGHAPQLGLIFNAIVAALTVVIVAVTASVLSMPARTSAWLACLLPASVIWSSLLLRESLTWLLIAASALGFAGIAVSKHKWRYVAVLGLALPSLLSVRGTAAVVVAAAGCLAIALVYRRLAPFLALGGLGLTAVMASPLGARLDAIVGGYSLDSINTSRDSLSRSAETGWPTVDISGPYSAVEALAVTTPRVLFGPFPWEWLSISPLLSLDALVWLVILGLATFGFLKHGQRRIALVLILPAVALLLALILTSGNYGTMQRLRLQPTILILPLAAAGLAELLRSARLLPRKSDGPNGLQSMADNRPGQVRSDQPRQVED